MPTLWDYLGQAAKGARGGWEQSRQWEQQQEQQQQQRTLFVLQMEAARLQNKLASMSVADRQGIRDIEAQLSEVLKATTAYAKGMPVPGGAPQAARPQQAPQGPPMMAPAGRAGAVAMPTPGAPAGPGALFGGVGPGVALPRPAASPAGPGMPGMGAPGAGAQTAGPGRKIMGLMARLAIAKGEPIPQGALTALGLEPQQKLWPALAEALGRTEMAPSEAWQIQPTLRLTQTEREIQQKREMRDDSAQEYYDKPFSRLTADEKVDVIADVEPEVIEGYIALADRPLAQRLFMAQIGAAETAADQAALGLALDEAFGKREREAGLGLVGAQTARQRAAAGAERARAAGAAGGTGGVGGPGMEIEQQRALQAITNLYEFIYPVEKLTFNEFKPGADKWERTKTAGLPKGPLRDFSLRQLEGLKADYQRDYGRPAPPRPAAGRGVGAGPAAPARALKDVPLKSVDLDRIPEWIVVNGVEALLSQGPQIGMSDEDIDWWLERAGKTRPKGKKTPSSPLLAPVAQRGALWELPGFAER